jgi:uracil-DNA glycosylase
MSLKRLLDDVRACKLCKTALPFGPRPVLQLGSRAKILIIGQAPGRKVHESGLPWNDASGDRLRSWLGLDRPTFYDETRVAVLPIGFCYPGADGTGGDKPPRPECAPRWHSRLLEHLPHVKLTLLVGRYAQKHYLRPKAKTSLTDTVRTFSEYGPRFFPLPHPSWRSAIWMRKHPWFKQEVVPHLRTVVHTFV